MHISAVDSISPDRLSDSLPIDLVQTPSRSAVAGLIVAVLTALLFLLTPFWLIAARAIAEPALFASLFERPFAALQLGCGLLAVTALAGLAMSRLDRILGRRRDVSIESGVLRVVDTRFGWQRRWQQPLAAYCGLARTIRSTMSGTRHQIVLVHPDAQRNVVLHVATRADGAAFDKWRDLLDLPEVPARLIISGNRTQAMPGDRPEVVSAKFAA